MSSVPTVEVYSKEFGGDELIRVNASDFNADVHRLVGDGPWGSAKGSELKGKLPEDFPGRRELEAADPPIHTYGQLRKAIKENVKVPGIGDAKQQQILERLGDSLQVEDGGEED
jgi:hypothetical protein